MRRLEGGGCPGRFPGPLPPPPPAAAKIWPAEAVAGFRKEREAGRGGGMSWWEQEGGEEMSGCRGQGCVGVGVGVGVRGGG